MTHPPTFFGRTLDSALWKAAQELEKSPADLEFRSEELDGGLHKVEILSVPQRKGPAPEPPAVSKKAQDQSEVCEQEEDSVEVSAIPETDDSVELATAFLKEIGELSGFPMDFEIERKGSQLVVEFTEEGRQELLSDGGRLLDSIQYLVNRVVQKHVDPSITLMADVGDDVRNRNGRLAAMAQELADRALEIGYPVHVEAALSPDRRTIHTALAGRRDVRTESDGAGAFRKLVISPSTRDR